MAVAEAEFLAHVDAGDVWQRNIADAVAHREQQEFSLARTVVRLEGGRRTAEHEHGALEAGERLGDDARVIAR